VSPTTDVSPSTDLNPSADLSPSTAERDREQRREQLLDAADRVVGRAGPAASMSAIAAEAGITKPILYRVFGDKGGLYRALAERHTAELLDVLRAALAAPGDLRARTGRTIDAYLGLIESAPETYRFLMRGEPASEPGVRGQVATFLRRFGEVLATGIRRELGEPDEATPVATVWAHAIVGMVQAAGDWWLDHPEAVTRAELTAELTGLLHGAFPARAGSANCDRLVEPSGGSPAPARESTWT